jgi:hypothetical protein
MKKLINRIKFRLLQRLLTDICSKCTGCENCRMGCESIVSPGYYECFMEDLTIQSREAWELRECGESEDVDG